MFVSCPSCACRLKVRDDLEPGKKVRCPGCAEVFAPDPAPAKPARPENVRVRSRSGGPRSAPDEEPEGPSAPRRHGGTGRPRREEDSGEDDTGEPVVKRKRRRKPVKKDRGAALLWGIVLGGAVLVLGLAGLIFFLVRSGGVPAEHLAAAKEMLDQLDELATVLEGVKDPATARAAAVRVNQLTDRQEALWKKVVSLPRLSREQNQALEKELGARQDSVRRHYLYAMMQATQKSQGEPSLAAALQRFRDVVRRGSLMLPPGGP